MKDGIRRNAAFCCLLAAAVCALAPVFLSAALSLRQGESIGSYEAALRGAGAGKVREMRCAAEEYNAGIRREQAETFFVYRGEGATDEAYEKVLAVNGPVMAYLSIPSIGLHVPVLHGTGEETLAYAAGHMYGTGVPVGGEGCNAVIAGHTGLTARKIFDDIQDLSEGSVIDVHVLGEIHRYAVTAVNVVSPAVEAAFFQTEEGRDLITLYTCTPPGINTHRLIVTAERAEDPPAEAAYPGASVTAVRYDLSTLFKMALCCLIPAGMVFVRILRGKAAGRPAL